MILRNSRRRKTNLHVAWIDYKKAFDSLPHSWIAKCLEIVRVCGNIRQFLRVAMASWKTVLTVNGQVLDYVHIRSRFIEPTAIRNSHDSHDNNTQADMIRIPNFQVSNKDFPPTLHG